MRNMRCELPERRAQYYVRLFQRAHGAMTEHRDHLRQLVERLKGDLEKCASETGVEHVHHVRTGTRRVQATVETMVRAAEPATAEVKAAEKKWLRLLKKIRRAAAPVRDLDVHRILLEKLAKAGTRATRSGRAQAVADRDASASDAVSAHDEAVATLAPTMEKSTLEKEAEHLDAWLKHARDQQAQRLKKEIAKHAAKIDGCAAAFTAALDAQPRSRRRQRDPAEVALEAFARLDHEMPHLHAENLHDFRKGAKKARYIAEANEDDAHAREVGKVLKRLQDEIGDWHDWLVLAEEARAAFHPEHDAAQLAQAAGEGSELIALLDSERNQHYLKATRTAARLRGRLMGEWQALHARPRRTGIVSFHRQASVGSAMAPRRKATKSAQRRKTPKQPGASDF
jgi:CHAD domain-containing protein